jgi:hypothetical protein
VGNYNQNGGRSPSDEDRPSWRPQDQSAAAPRNRGNEDDHDYGSWRDRNQDRQTADRDPDRWEGSRGSELGHGEGREPGRSTERYGQGQSGYSAGRYGEDRSQQIQNRNEMMRGPGSREDRGLGIDDRFTGRGEDRGYGPRGREGGGSESERGGSWRAYDPPPGRNQMTGGYGPRRGGYDQQIGYQGSGGRQGESMDYRRGYGGPGYGGQGGQGYGEPGFGGQSVGGQGYGDERGPGYGGLSDAGPSYGQRGGYSGRGYAGQRDGGQGYGGPGYGSVGYGGSQIYDGSHGTQDDPQRMGSLGPHAPRRAGPHRGKGPHGYQRSDERIRELVCEALADDEHIDASEIHVSVKDGEVTLTGTVDDRRTRREAEDCVAAVSGVHDVLVQLRVRDDRVGLRSGSGSTESGSSQAGGSPASGSEAGRGSATGQPTGSASTSQQGANKPEAEPSHDKKPRA